MLDINNMKKSDFFYDLPEELIAQTPIEPRSASRMMTLDRRSGEVGHSRFYNLCRAVRGGRTAAWLVSLRRSHIR